MKHRYAARVERRVVRGPESIADATHGDLGARFRASIRKVAALPCDILITVHPDVSGLDRKLRQAERQAEPNPFVDAQACRAYAGRAEAMLDARIAEERAAATEAKRATIIDSMESGFTSPTTTTAMRSGRYQSR